MSNLPGNPHAEAVREACKNGANHRAQIEATLALAYEQRTANLIAWQSLGIQIESQKGNTSEPSPEAEDDIANRLGLGGNNE